MPHTDFYMETGSEQNSNLSGIHSTYDFQTNTESTQLLPLQCLEIIHHSSPPPLILTCFPLIFGKTHKKGGKGGLLPLWSRKFNTFYQVGSHCLGQVTSLTRTKGWPKHSLSRTAGVTGPDSHCAEPLQQCRAQTQISGALISSCC